MPEKTLKERLENYFALNKELPLIEDDICKERNKIEYAGCYQEGYDREKTLTISTGKLKSLNALLDRKAEIRRELDFLDDLVFRITESEMRQILTVAYLHGGGEKRWERVADHFEREITGESYRKKTDRFLAKLELASEMSKMSRMS